MRDRSRAERLAELARHCQACGLDALERLPIIAMRRIHPP